MKYLYLVIILFGFSACISRTGVNVNTPFPIDENWNPSITAPTPSATKTLLRTPTLSPTPLVCWGVGGKLVEGEIESELVVNPFEFLIYLPPCYFDETERVYPVLYLIHGQSYTQDQWDRLGADEAADTLIAGGEIPPFLIVMPRVIDWEQPPDAKFGQAVVDELIPYVDKTFRTMPDRGFRAVGGLSRGSAWALHLGLSRWDVFGIFGAHSLPIFYNDAPLIAGWVDDIPLVSFPRIYIDLADQDLKSIRSSTEWFVNLLVEKGIPHEFYVFPGIHVEEYWSAHMEEYIRFYSSEW